MSNNSNQTGTLLLLAVILGAAIYAFMFFGSSMEQTNTSASFGQLSKKASANLLSNNNQVAVTEFCAKEIRSDLSGVSLPNHKMKSTSGADYAQSTNPDFPSTGIAQSDVQNLNGSSSITRNNSSRNYASNQSQSFAFGNSSVEYISNSHNPSKSDINALLLLDAHAAEAAMTTQQGSKRATPALAAKTASVSTSMTNSKTASKIGGDPGEPGASLPVGDGVWVLLAFVGVYSVSRTVFRV